MQGTRNVLTIPRRQKQVPIYSLRSPVSFLYFLLRRLPLSSPVRKEPSGCFRISARPRFEAPRPIVIADPLSRDISDTDSHFPYGPCSSIRSWRVIIIHTLSTMGEDPEKPLSTTDTTSRSSALGDLCLEDTIDSVLEKKLLWKCDLHVVPVISLLYMLAFLDRINIGNARLQGLEVDLRMSGSDYNVALFVFFIPYILFEVPSNIIIRKLSPSTWLSLIMVCWGELW